VLPDKLSKFDLKNELEIYVGQSEGHVGENYTYMPYPGQVETRGRGVK
jgi:hypothetical protein